MYSEHTLSTEDVCVLRILRYITLHYRKSELKYKLLPKQLLICLVAGTEDMDYMHSGGAFYDFRVINYEPLSVECFRMPKDTVGLIQKKQQGEVADDTIRILTAYCAIVHAGLRDKVYL